MLVLFNLLLPYLCMYVCMYVCISIVRAPVDTSAFQALKGLPWHILNKGLNYAAYISTNFLGSNGAVTRGIFFNF